MAPLTWHFDLLCSTNLLRKANLGVIDITLLQDDALHKNKSTMNSLVCTAQQCGLLPLFPTLVFNVVHHTDEDFANP